MHLTKFDVERLLLLLVSNHSKLFWIRKKEINYWKCRIIIIEKLLRDWWFIMGNFNLMIRFRIIGIVCIRNISCPKRNPIINHPLFLILLISVSRMIRKVLGPISQCRSSRQVNHMRRGWIAWEKKRSRELFRSIMEIWQARILNIIISFSLFRKVEIIRNLLLSH